MVSFHFGGLPFNFLTYLLDLTQVSISYGRSCSVLVFGLQRLLIFFFTAYLSLDLGEWRDADIMSFLLVTVNRPLLVVLQLHGPFTELAAPFS